MQRYLFPLVSYSAQDDFQLYAQMFQKEGFRLIQVKNEKLLLTADAVVLYCDDTVLNGAVNDSYIRTAARRDIPVILIHADAFDPEYRQLFDESQLIDAGKVSFEGLRTIIDENKPFARKETKPRKESNILPVILLLVTLFFAGMLIWRISQAAFDHPKENAAEVSPVTSQAEDAVVQVYAIGSMSEESWRGCGFAVNEDGYIVTNAHVIDHAAVGYKIVYRQTAYEAKLISRDEIQDVALMKIDTRTSRTLQFTRTLPDPGDTLYTVGYPGKQRLTVLEGVWLGGDIQDENGMTYTRIQMPLEAGVSGSPVIDTDGNVVGIASAVSTSVDSLAYIVSAETALDFLSSSLFIGN